MKFYTEIVTDAVMLFVGGVAQNQFTTLFDVSTPTPRLVLIHAKCEVVYYTWQLIIDPTGRLHHVLTMMYLYFGWNFKMGISRSLFVCTLSNLFLTLALHCNNPVTDITFACMFIYARIYQVGWLVHEYCTSPLNTAPILEYYTTSCVILFIYGMQWFWLTKMAQYVYARFYGKHPYLARAL